MRYFLLATAMLTSILAWADDYNYITVQKNDAASTQESTALSEFTNIRVKDSNLILFDGDTQVKSYALDELHKLFFTKEPTEIKEIETETTSGRTYIYNISGILIASDIDIDKLPKGVYIVKNGNKTDKIVKR